LEQGHLQYLVPFFANISAYYARWTYDLPASERYHHTFRFGLLIHSAETVERAVALSRDLMESFAPVWHEVLIALALLHDFGRLFEVEVVDQRDGVTWDPLREPLDDFYKTRFVPLEDHFRWRPGRGIRTHEYRALDLQPHILGPYYEDEFQLRLVDAWWKYFKRVWKSDFVHDFYQQFLSTLTGEPSISSCAVGPGTIFSSGSWRISGTNGYCDFSCLGGVRNPLNPGG